MYGKLFGQFLYDQGIITKGELKDGLLKQDTVNHPLGILALEQDMLIPEQLREILAFQKKSNQRLGQIAIDHGYLDSEQVAQLLAIQQKAHLFLGEILVRQGTVSPDVLHAQLALFHAHNRELETRFKERLRTIRTPIPLQLILETIQSYFSRAICGKAKATAILPCDDMNLKNMFITAAIARDMAACESRIILGFTLGRREALSLCYCLTDTSIHGQNRVAAVVENYAESLGYLIDNTLRRAGYPVPHSRISMYTDAGPALNAELCIHMNTTIGPLILFFNTIPLDGDMHDPS